jgi:RNA polymerase sigma-70 factor (ECF subfamily)
MSPLCVAPPPPTAPLDQRSKAAIEEKDLVERLKRQDEQAFETLIRLHGPHMLAVARRYMRAEADAQDVVQDALLNVFKAIGRFDGASRISTWLHRIVINAALMRIRSRSRHQEASIEELGAAPDVVGVPRVSWSLSAAEVLGRDELRNQVRAAVDALPDVFRIPVRLRDIEGMDMETICDGLGIGMSTLKTRLHRGRALLRTALDSRLGAA